MASSRTFNAWGVLAVVVLSIAPSSWAAEFAGGTGEPNNPYQIATAEHLVSIGSDPNLLDKHFILIADINLDPNLPGGRVFSQAVIAADIIRIIDPDPNLPRGQISSQAVVVLDIIPRTGKRVVVERFAFTGVLDGKGHVVKNLAVSDAFTIRGVGMFGTIGASGRVENLGLENASIKGTHGVGGLAGYNDGTILGCHVFGQVTASQYSGGLIGRNHGSVVRSHATGAVFGGDKSEALGGLAGQNYDGAIVNCWSGTAVHAGDGSDYLGTLVGDNTGSVSGCYATASVSAGGGGMFIGGLVGYNTSNIVNCYATGSVLAGYGSTSIGGFVGNNPFGTVANCYAVGRVDAGTGSKNVGGFLGYAISAGDVVHCFWDMQASGTMVSEGGTGFTTTEMQDVQRYLAEGWDWVGERANGTADLWLIPEAGGYPTLAAFCDQAQRHTLRGSGTHNDPYRIATVDDIGAMSRYDPSACYRLEADLDMSGIAWTTAPIAGVDGNFEGGGHVISNFTIRGGGCAGLFGTLAPRAVVRGVRVWNAAIVSTGRVYNSAVLAGENLGSISDCHATGSVSGWNSVGGLVGSNHWGKIARSCAEVDVCTGGDYACGGFAGVNAGEITTCFAAGRISGGNEAQKVGGLVGYNTHLGHITNSYARGHVSGGEDSRYLGGFVGHNEVFGLLVNCYATAIVSGGAGSWSVGGFAGRSEVSTTVRGPDGALEVTVNGCYFLGAPGVAIPTNSVGSPLMDEQMKKQSSFVGWDFNSIWTICEGKDYPRLQWEGVQCQP